MKAKLTDDGLHISGYVNVPGRESRPVYVPRLGKKVIEIIEPGAFKKAFLRAKEIKMVIDHNKENVVAETKNGTLKAYEDNIGARADARIKDKDVIKAAQQGRIRGWSFNMTNVVDKVEERAEGYNIRRVKDFDIGEITLSINSNPFYTATSVEYRAGDENGEEVEIEYRSSVETLDFIDDRKPDNTAFAERLNKLKKGD